VVVGEHPVQALEVGLHYTADGLLVTRLDAELHLQAQYKRKLRVKDEKEVPKLCVLIEE